MQDKNNIKIGHFIAPNYTQKSNFDRKFSTNEGFIIKRDNKKFIEQATAKAMQTSSTPASKGIPLP